MKLFLLIVKMAFRSLFANRLRSFLAMLGIIIGVGSVIAIFNLGESLRQKTLSRIQTMGSNLLIITSSRKKFRGVRAASYQTLMPSDAYEILEHVKGIHLVSPVVSDGAQLKYFNSNSSASVYGAAADFFRIRGFEIEKGRRFSDLEVLQIANVAVIGSKTARELFKNESPIGKTIQVKSIRFRIIGLMKEEGSQGWSSPDQSLVIPYSTALKKLKGQGHINEIDVTTKEGFSPYDVEPKIRALLRRLHRLPPQKEDDFDIHNMQEVLNTVSSISLYFTIFLGGIAGISLLVGGIGIMNIMLVTVTERTREIGLRKAIGAKERHILLQFLIESLVLTSLGGMIGTSLGIALCHGVGHFADIEVVNPLSSIITALLFSIGVGVFFGFYPAWKAARLDPIEALRFE